MKFIIFIIMLALFLNSCHNSCQKNNVDKDSIVVFYYRGWVEFPISQNINDMAIKATERNADTIIYIGDSDYEEFISHTDYFNHIERGIFDSRFVIIHDSIVIGFPYPDIILYRDDGKLYIYGYESKKGGVIADAEFVYKIKNISGYYNYFSEEDLAYDKTIQEYGVPHNHQLELDDELFDYDFFKKTHPNSTKSEKITKPKKIRSSKKIVIKRQIKQNEKN